MQGTKPKVAIIAPGNMGAGVGWRLVEHGLAVLTFLDGRSAASRRRAEEAGMAGVGLDEITMADFLLSIVPPAEALGLAEVLAPRLAAQGGRTLYVDCNAVSPRTVKKIGEVLKGIPFVDAGIIGLPPRQGEGPASMRAGTLRGALPTCRIRPIDQASRWPDRRRFRAQNVLCGHHQGLVRARRRDTARGKPGRSGGRAPGRA